LVKRRKELHYETCEERELPPNLFVNLSFSDQNGNGILEAMESSKVDW